MKKIIANSPLCVLVCKATAYKHHTNRNIQLTVEKVVYLLEQQETSSVTKKITDDILNKIYTEKGAITGISLILSTVDVRKEFTGFQLAKSQLMLEKGAGQLCGCLGNSLIKSLKPFEDDAKIRLLNFLMQLQTARKNFYQDGFTQN